MSKLSLEKERYKLAHDESGHSYAIPVRLDEAFDVWVENEGVGEIDFDEYRIDGRFTFTDPKNE